MLIDASRRSASILRKIEWIDTHAHLNFNIYKEDGSKVLQRSLDNGVWMINVGSQYSTSQRAVEMAGKYETGVFAAIGLHPIHSGEEFDRAKYKELAKSNKVVAIGEIGLDYKLEYVLFREKQKQVFLKQLDLAEELDLPVIIHCRMAHEDLISELKARGNGLRGVIHCFTGTWTQAQKYMEMGFCLGINGIIFKMDLEEVIKKAPLDKILLETDCPYLTPKPMEGRNEPSYVKYVAEKIAKIKGLSYKEIAKTTTQNAKLLFRI
ncbi:MAG: TatD family hydrolase [Patescibacteria group bacterium]